MPVGRDAVKWCRVEGTNPQAGPSNPAETSFPHGRSSLCPAGESGDPLRAHPPASPPMGGVTSALIPLITVEDAARAPASPPS